MHCYCLFILSLTLRWIYGFIHHITPQHLHRLSLAPTQSGVSTDGLANGAGVTSLEGERLSHATRCQSLPLVLQQLSMLPLMEPLIGVNLAHFAPYGSSQLNGESLLSGAFGSASLDGVSDYYSQLAYKVRRGGVSTG